MALDANTPTAVPVGLSLMVEELQTHDSASNEENQQYPSGFEFSILLLAIGMSLILVGLVGTLHFHPSIQPFDMYQDFNMIATAVPAITTHFHTISDVGWYYLA